VSSSLDISRFEDQTPPHLDWAKAEVTVTPEGGSLSTGTLSKPLDLSTDWSGVLRGFGLDPDIFEVDGDTVKMSKWQQSARSKAGDRDVVWLYAYSARFTRKTPKLTDVDIAAIVKGIQRWKPQPLITKPLNEGSTFLVCLADLQIGKSQGGGIEGATERIMAALNAAVKRLAELRKMGRNIESVCVANMGDPIEGCDGNYPSQLFTVKASLREQLNVALNILVKACEMLGADTVISTLSNHSEWMRRGGKAVTSDSDSADGYLIDTLMRMFEMAERGPTTWHIPHDEMVTAADLSGVNVAFSHGHRITGDEHKWLQNHSIRLLRETGTEPRIWITAHKHHYYARDFGPWFRFQCPSLDGGSKWYTDATGLWSTPGLLTMLVGTHDKRGFSDVSVL
jgi:uncharacterized protein YbjQ (UPF0145 family)